MFLFFAGGVLAAVFFLARYSIRRSREHVAAARALTVGRQIAAWLEYWFFCGISPHLEKYLAISPGYASTLQDKSGKRYRDVITLTVVYDPNGIRFDLESMVRRQVDYIVQTLFPRCIAHIRFRQGKPEELHGLRRSPMKHEPSAVGERTLAGVKTKKVCCVLFGNLGGTLGRQIVQAYDPANVPHAHLAVFDLDQTRSDTIFAPIEGATEVTDYLSAWGDEKERFFRPNLGNGIGAGGNHQVATSALEEIKEQVLDFIDGATLIIGVACPSGGSGGSIVRFAELAAEKKIPFECHLIRPFADEGDVSIQRFLGAYRHLQALPGVCIIDHHNEYAFDPSNPFAAEFKRTSKMLEVLNDRALRPSFEATINLALRVHSVLSRDLNDLVSVVAPSKRGYVYQLDLAQFKQGESYDVPRIIEALLGDRFQRPDVIEGASRALVMYPDEFSPFNQRMVTEAIMAKMKNGDPTAVVDFRKGVTAIGETIIISVGSDIPDPGPEVRPPWMLSSSTVTSPLVSAKPSIVPVSAPLLPEPVRQSEPEPLSEPQLEPMAKTIDVAIAVGVRGIRIEPHSLPADLADRVTSFAAQYRDAELEIAQADLPPPDLCHTLRGTKESVWKGLQAAVQPHLKGNKMADLERIKFVNRKRSEITRHVTPITGLKYRDFIAACERKTFPTVEAAQAALAEVNVALLAELGQQMEPTASTTAVRQALGIPIPEPVKVPRSLFRRIPEGDNRPEV